MSPLGGRVVLLGSDYGAAAPGDSGMEFRLTYAGPLYATQRDAAPGQKPKHVENKHNIRVSFHGQLKNLWEFPPLKQVKRPPVIVDGSVPEFQEPAVTPEKIAMKYSIPPFKFVPLVTLELDLLCELEILLLRPDRPGQVYWAGDIDNRLKTLLDALRVPEINEGYDQRHPLPDGGALYCLLEDDKLITKLSVETDRMLEPVGIASDMANVRLFITVRIRPFDFNLWNMHFS
jgi:hypothetical protein